MKFSSFSKNAALLAVLTSASIAAAASCAAAMPVDGGAAASIAAPLRRVVDGHRVYPGSDTAAAQKARDERNAPNRFCEKQQQYCE